MSDDVPIALLNAFLAELPRLGAEESLVAAERVAVGSGSLKKGRGRSIAAGWRRAAGRPAEAMRPRTREQWAFHAGVAGVPIRIVKKEPADG